MKYAVLPLAAEAPTRSPPRLAFLAFFALGFGFSLWYLEAYYMGDQRVYRLFYDSTYQMPSNFWPMLQLQHLGSSEPLYGYIIGAAAYWGVDRTAYLSAWNGVLVAGIGYALIKYRCSLIFSILILSNYYLLVILGPAERLKFAYICLVLAFSVESMKAKVILSLGSPFFHTQAIIQFVSGAAYYVVSNLRSLLKTPLKSILLLVSSAAALAAVTYVFFGLVGQTIEAKSVIYFDQSSGLSEAIQWAMLLAGGLVAFRGRLAYFVGMMPMGVMTILFGNRVNVATFVLFVGIAMLQRKTNHPIILAVMAYMSFKSIGFMINVVQYGTGFIS